MVRVGVGAAVLALTAVAWVSPAAAGGSAFYPVEDRYEPGEVATVIGFTGGGQLGWIDDGPFFGYLRPAAEDGGVFLPGPQPGDLAVGRLELVETGEGGWLALRAGVSFEVPADLAPGVYTFNYCNDPCTTGLGDLVASSVFIGVDPPHELSRGWPSHLVADLPPVSNEVAPSTLDVTSAAQATTTSSTRSAANAGSIRQTPARLVSKATGGADPADRASSGDGGPQAGAVAAGSHTGGPAGATALWAVAVLGGLSCALGAVVARRTTRRNRRRREAPCV